MVSTKTTYSEVPDKREGQNKRAGGKGWGGGRKNFQNLINGGGRNKWGGRKLKKRLKMLVKRWKEQKQVTIYT